MFLLQKGNSVRGGDYSSGGLFSSGGGIPTGAIIIAVIIAIIVAIVVFFLVVQRKKAFKGRFANWMREYLNFRSILIAGIIKILYLFFAVFLTIMSVIVMFQGEGSEMIVAILAGLAMLIFGNILLRITMELTMALIVVWENTSDIRAIIVKRDELFGGGKGGLKDEAKEEQAVEKAIVEQLVANEVVNNEPAEAQQPEVQQPEAQQPEVIQPEVK